MKKYFSIGEAAKATNLTTETLRHYDRIDLIIPSRKDEWTNYRYYTIQDIIKLNTVHALQQMDISLKRIKEVLEYNDIQKILDFLTEAEKKADQKIAALQYSKSKMQTAKEIYQNKLAVQQSVGDIAVKHFSRRAIMISDTLTEPTLDNLWNYLGHFYDKIESSEREQYDFEDLAGIYTKNGTSRLFAVCTKYPNTNELIILPEGNYLCADCTEESRIEKINELLQIAKQEYTIEPDFHIQLIIISGILQWDYQVQLFVGK